MNVTPEPTFIESVLVLGGLFVACVVLALWCTGQLWGKRRTK